MYKIVITVNGIEKTIDISKPLKDKDKIAKIGGKWYIIRYS